MIQMTQVLVQAKGFDLTEALEKACQDGAEKLLKYDSALEKAEFFLSGSSKRGFCTKLKLARAGKDLFFEYRAKKDLYQIIKEVCKKAKEKLSEFR